MNSRNGYRTAERPRVPRPLLEAGFRAAWDQLPTYSQRTFRMHQRTGRDLIGYVVPSDSLGRRGIPSSSQASCVKDFLIIHGYVPHDEEELLRVSFERTSEGDRVVVYKVKR